MPPDLLVSIKDLENSTRQNDSMTVLACIDYGGRDEIIRAVNKAVERGVVVREKEFSQLLDTYAIPDPDLIIRTSGERRTSGFMIWQSVYSEWAFPQVYFPDFSLDMFVNTLREFSKRERRFGR